MPDSGPRGKGGPGRGRGGACCSVCRLQVLYFGIFLLQGTSGEIEAGLTSRKSSGFSPWEAVLLRVNALTVVTTTLVGQ
jgi:hypothetical protein